MNDALVKALQALREKTDGESFDGSVRFDVADHGALRVDGEGAREDDGSPADCTISADIETFRALFEGEISPTGAYMTGRIRIEGDMGVAMRAASLLG
jgi:putative sterol carrier protein